MRTYELADSPPHKNPLRSQRVGVERSHRSGRSGRTGRHRGPQLRLPAFRYHGGPLLGFALNREHLSLYPFSPQVVETVAPQLDGYGLSKAPSASPWTVPSLPRS